jgi:vancomycin resistance protein YoaR
VCLWNDAVHDRGGVFCTHDRVFSFSIKVKRHMANRSSVRDGAPVHAAQSTDMRTPDRRRLSLARRAIGVVLLTLMSGIGLVIAGLLILEQRNQELIYPNIYVENVPVGGRTRAEAHAAIREPYKDFLERPATLRDGDTVWQASLVDVGVAFDFDAPIEQAYRIGRDGAPPENLETVLELRENSPRLAVPITFDNTAVERYVASLATDIDRAPINAQIRLEGAQIVTTPATPGRRLLVDATVRDLSTQLKTLRPAVVTLRVETLPPRIGDRAVAVARERLAALLAEPLTLKADEQEHVWTPERLASLITITQASDRDRAPIGISIDGERVLKQLRQIADATEVRGTYPRVAWNGGDLQITKPGKPGRRVDEINARDLVLAALRGQERTIELPWRAIDPPVTEANLDQLGINELVSLGKSDFAGSAAYRVTNIVAGTRRLDGILLAPGDEFSFTSTVGAINAANGFVEGAAIVQNRTQKEFGGGICQVSTTMFRAAFWAGLPITERWEHSFYINWYDKYGLGANGNGPGLDAAIFTGVKDFKFVNDTGAWLLVQTAADPRTAMAQVAIYGTKPAREVTLTGYRVYNQTPAPGDPVFVADAEQPAGALRQSDRARGGMTIDVYRVITENGVSRAPELFRTRFRAWPNIFVVNPADMGPDGKPRIAPGTGEATQPSPTPDPNAPMADPNAGLVPTVSPENHLAPTPAPDAPQNEAPSTDAGG